MDVEFYATKAQADVLWSRQVSEANYDRLPERSMYFAFIDQKFSSASRAVSGAKHGYVRGEAFISLVNSVIGKCSEIKLIKEIGDEVFLVSESFRSLLESCLLIEFAANNLSDVIGSAGHPFGIRAAIGFGVVKRIARPQEDYIGSPIDQLARVMGIRSNSSNVLIHEDGFKINKDLFREYGAAIAVSSAIRMTSDQSKNFPDDIFYREVVVNRQVLGALRDCFVCWK